MYITPIILLAYAATTLAAPLTVQESTTSTFNATLDPRKNLNACPANEKHNLQDSVYLAVMNQFCNRHTPTEIVKDTPLVFTYDVTAYDGKPIRWIFKVRIDPTFRVDIQPGSGHDETKYAFTMTNQLCKDRFKGFLEGEGGGMPKVYCEWDNDKDTRDVLVRGGSFREDLPSHGKQWLFGEAVWETRERKG
ncbi:hypothetical protein CFE70_009494 [Pyrenophora teres f. teres 0-1]|uniref:Uncharacterized protein n=2 Tax=Pyrenophora teres f. teres TaxID=97479 RepID=E3RVB0_PYRTT|nr:hypothetical protein PTT_13097 [Pyrenophora teres f. teres 0-1]KAE8824026.1 hypothetical protein HRS9139_09208 [Pyrenophora teres f. teres]KAE8827230.1 hypothetical protein PTNB85_08583 [Pyrenophora teres f. teres]KAE8855082.1 hypothetical protein PTNB29_09333 [Pyrenophora teres f. teres]KAK1916669.1 hypothetical protein P3342_012294 [Pyrenophora teres f. teres]